VNCNKKLQISFPGNQILTFCLTLMLIFTDIRKQNLTQRPKEFSFFDVVFATKEQTFEFNA